MSRHHYDTSPAPPWSPSSAASEDTQITLPATTSASAEDEALQEGDLLLAELERHEDVRFISYRTAAKLRSLQRQTYLHHIDIWNMIEAFRENGLHGLDASTRLSEAHVHRLLTSLYVGLQKRLPPPPQSAASSSSSSSLMPTTSGATATSQQFGLQGKANLLLTFLWRALKPTADKVKVRSVKTALATLCTGKLMDKLRYIFSQLADGNGIMVHGRFQHFLRDVMKIPMALGEYSTFSESQESGEVIFDPGSKVTVNDFLEAMMSDPGPQCLSWLLVLHRLINSENVYHPVTCGSCRLQGFQGLRYKSDRANYHLCQNCFWRGKISASHTDDVFKEYNSFKSTSSKSLKRSLHCVPSEKRSKGHLPHFPEEPERTLDMSNLVPSTSSLGQLNGSFSMYRGKAQSGEDSGFGMTDEHSLIAHYAHQLAQGGVPHRRRDASPGRSALNHSKQIVQDLEKRNRDIMRDISQLRKYHDLDLQKKESSPELVSELNHLRSHKVELDDCLAELQDTRKELMTELEELMKLLHTQKVSPNAPNPEEEEYLDQASNGGAYRSTFFD